MRSLAKPDIRQPGQHGLMIVIIFAVTFLSGCMPPKYIIQPLPLEKAVRLMADNLLNQVMEKRGVQGVISDTDIVMDNIIDAETGEETNISHRIEDLIVEQARNFPKLSIRDMAGHDIASANYVMTGIIRWRDFEGRRTISLSTSVLDRATNLIIAHSDALVDDGNLSFEPTPIYKDSPVYIKDRRVKSLINTAQTKVGGAADSDYVNTLPVNVLLRKAKNYYNNGDYTQTVELLSKVANRDDGKVMQTFSFLYETYLKLGRKGDAEEAFSNLVDIGIQERNLTMKFHFETAKTIFLKSDKFAPEFTMWLRQISKHILSSNMCVQIIGHTSKSGTKEFNDKLSKDRADEIQDQLAQMAKDKGARTGKGAAQSLQAKTKTVGLGFTQCKDCRENESLNSSDRRVEFNVVDCGTH